MVLDTMRGILRFDCGLSLVLVAAIAFSGKAQDATPEEPVGYQMRYDDPYDINKLFVQFIPLYGEVSSSNMSIGFGLEADYYLENKFDFTLHARRAYSKRSDIMRQAAEKNVSNSNSNKANTYGLLEFGATYHYRDFEEEKKSKVFLYAKKYKGDALETHIMKTAEILNKVRKIYGARLGGMVYSTSFDMNRALQNQNQWLISTAGTPMDSTASLYGNLNTLGLYIGGSMSWIRNFSVDFEREYDPGGDDLLLTAFFDILIAPSVKVEDIIYMGETYPTDPLAVNKIGFRGGVEGKFNRELSWGYGAEVGFRPSVQSQGFFLLLKLSFPIYGTKLDKTAKVDAVEQE